MPILKPKTLLSASFLLGACLGLAIYLLFLSGAFEHAELGALDARYWAKGESAPSEDIVLVVITHRCLTQLGNFPWPRTYHAKLIDFLKSAGARVIAFDIFFSHPAEDPKEDIALASSVKSAGNVILPVFSPYRISKIPPEGGYVPVDSIMESTKPVSSAAYRQAHINVLADRDGIYRKIPLSIRHSENIYNNLGMEAAMRFLNISPRQMMWDRDRFYYRDRQIPLEDSKFAYIDFAAIETESPRYAYVDVLNGLVDKGVFKDKLIVVGQAASGLPNADIIQTPFKEKYGVVVQASAAHTFLSGFHIRRLPKWITGLYIIGCCILMALLTVCVKTWTSVALALLFFAVLMFFSGNIFVTRGVILETAPLAASVIFSFSAGIVYRVRFADRTIMAKELELDSILQAGRFAAAGLDTGRPSDIIMGGIIGAVGTKGLILHRRNKKTGKLERSFIYGIGQEITAGPFSKKELELAREAMKLRKAFLIESVKRDRRFRQAGFDAPADSVMCVPMMLKGEVVGALNLFDKTIPGRPQAEAFTKEDLKLAAILAQQATIALENARLLEEVNELFLSSIKSLAETIDAKDPYTRGHSERVTSISLAIADAMGIDGEDRKNIMIGAILHDIGKIGIKDSVLSKPSNLTDEEKKIFDQHPTIGAKIMGPIEQLAPNIPIIRHHHERFDGQGYPDGLKAGSIPLAARIVAVADTFDAMTSDRPYRGALSEAVAAKEINSVCGKQFDPQVVKAFNEAYQKGRIKNEGA